MGVSNTLFCLLTAYDRYSIDTVSNTLFCLLTAYVRYSIDTVSNTLFYLLTAYTDACKTHRTITVFTTVFLKMNSRARNM